MWFTPPSFDDSFWTNFWPGFFGNCLADIFVAIVLVWLLRQVGLIFRRAKLEFTIEAKRVDIQLYTLICNLENTGQLGFGAKEAIWHIYLDPDLDVLPWPHDNIGIMVFQRSVPETFDGRQFTHYQGWLDGPIFPGGLFVPLVLQCIVTKDGHYPIHYFMSTIHGEFPKRSLWNKTYRQFERLRGRSVPTGTKYDTIDLDLKA